MNLDTLSHEELVGIRVVGTKLLQKTLKYLGPKELEEVATIKTKRAVVDHTKKKISDALSISDEVFNDIFSKTWEFLEVILTAPSGSPRSVYIEKLNSIWKHFTSIEKALFTVLALENLLKVMAMSILKQLGEENEETKIPKH